MYELKRAIETVLERYNLNNEPVPEYLTSAIDKLEQIYESVKDKL